jgi:FAD/FMN-containing dehydrogenase
MTKSKLLQTDKKRIEESPMNSLQVTTLEGSSVSLDIAAIEEFTAGLRGPSFLQGDAEYDAARIIWNGSTDKHPAIIVQCSGTADVIDAVNFARSNDLLVAVRGGGHNVAGNAVCEGGVVIDLSNMNSVRVDPGSRRAFVGGGALLGDVDRETQAFGLATPLGVVSLTGVAGLTLCGGLGYLRRKYGMACDALVSVDVVTADGKLVKASETENPDLFWGVRGGGGNFGVVTSFEFELYPVGPTVTLCAPFYAIDENTEDLVCSWRDFMSQAPEEVTSNCLFWSVPAHPNFPEELQGIPVVIPAAIHIGDVEGALEFLQPLRELGEPILDLSGPIPYAALQTAFDPLFAKGERQNYWKSLYLDVLDDKAIGNIVDRARNRPDPWSLIALWHLGGAMNRVAPEATALGERSANYLFSLDTSWTDPADSKTAIAWTRDAWAEMQPFSRGGSYLNFPGEGEEGEALLRASYGSDNYDRLVELKSKFDPANLFRLNQNILPGNS